ncbi:PhnB protein [Luteibacter sp. 621]|jgi:PhnB protein|uniref:VOC family protein n=1 Tax=Luteibacter sp. 621 TaxID=3373916 RepID=UPI003D19C810
MNITPYLHFKDNCEEAFAFYEKALGGQIIMTSRFKDMPPPPEGAANNEGCGPSPEEIKAMGEKIMHIRLQVGDAILMGSDTPPVFKHSGKVEGCTIALGFDTPAEAEKVFAALSEKGTVTMPIGETFWAERFGMLDDAFGVSWMVNGGEKKGP